MTRISGFARRTVSLTDYSYGRNGHRCDHLLWPLRDSAFSIGLPGDRGTILMTHEVSPISSGCWQTPEQIDALSSNQERVAGMPALRAIAQCSLDLLKLVSGERVLEVGCGTGVFLTALATAVGRSGQVGRRVLTPSRTPPGRPRPPCLRRIFTAVPRRRAQAGLNLSRTNSASTAPIACICSTGGSGCQSQRRSEHRSQ